MQSFILYPEFKIDPSSLHIYHSHIMIENSKQLKNQGFSKYDVAQICTPST